MKEPASAETTTNIVSDKEYQLLPQEDIVL